ncbi:MAG: hypothetical protein ACK47B_15245 [Armatimonadota bacterium]
MEVRKAMWLAAVMAAGLACAAGAAQAQDPPANDIQDILGAPLARPATIYLAERPQVSVEFAGDYGPVRVSGAIAGAPEQPLRLTDAEGRTRDATWSEIRSLSVVRFASAGLPVGSWQASLVSDPAAGSTTVSGTYASTSAADRGGWRLLELPEGALRLSGQPYGTLAIPLRRIANFEMVPIRSSIAEMPEGELRLEVVEGTTVGLPLRSVQVFQRDTRRGTVRVALEDGQAFTGKLVDLPNVVLNVGEGEAVQRIPLAQVAFLERVPPGGRRL